MKKNYFWLSFLFCVVLRSVAEEAPSDLMDKRSLNESASNASDRQNNLERASSGGVQELLDGLDLSSGSLNWRGKNFNLGESEMVRARFEKYLNAPSATSKEDIEYSELLDTINKRLIGKGGGSDSVRVAESWRLLYKASEFSMDNGLSETLADRVISFWQTNRKIKSLLLENERLEEEKRSTESSIRVISDRDRREFIELTRGKKGSESVPPPSMDYQLEPEQKRLEQTEQKIEENKLFEVKSKITQKLEFQSMILQFFVQRRFQHTLIANDFYRYIFNAEENSLQGAENLRNQIFGDLEVQLTTSTLDTLSKEAIGDVSQSIKTVEFLLDQGEVHMASKRLLEAFCLGEHLSPVKTFPLAKKRKILLYIRNLKSLASSIEVKSFSRAETLLEAIKKEVKDFDPSKPEAFINTSKQLSNLAVQKALTGAYNKDQGLIESALQEAVRYWPTNPQIQNFSSKMISQTDLQTVAVSDFDRYLQQGDLRSIFNDRFRFAAALAKDPDRNEAFIDIMKQMEAIESAMAQAKELSRIKNTYGAWEVLERVYREYPNDQALNRIRGDYAVKASVFASVISRAEEALSDEAFSEALFHYIAAREVYPASYFVEKGISASTEGILNEKEATINIE